MNVAGKDMMNEYEIMVTEKLVKTLCVTADTDEQVIKKVQRMIDQEELVLTADDYAEREIAIMFKRCPEKEFTDEETKVVPATDPEVSFYVACCGEFHGLAPVYENIPDAIAALRQYEDALEKYSNIRNIGVFMPEIGIRVSYKEHPDQDVEWGLLQGRVLDLSLLDRIEGIVNADSALRLIGELVFAVKHAEDVSSVDYQINGESVALNKVLATMHEM